MSNNSELIESVLRFQKAAFAGTGLDPTLPPPATEEQLAEAEQQLGFQLPEELKTLYRFCGAGMSVGSEWWFKPTELASQYAQAGSDFRTHHPNERYVQVSQLNEGPQARELVYFQKSTADQVVLESDGHGSTGKVWAYFVHSGEDPWTLLASSLGEYWSNLAYLAEAGWYRAGERKGVTAIEVVEEVESYPQYVADLTHLGLSHVCAYP